jgi:hypothetical protein
MERWTRNSHRLDRPVNTHQHTEPQESVMRRSSLPPCSPVTGIAIIPINRTAAIRPDLIIGSAGVSSLRRANSLPRLPNKSRSGSTVSPSGSTFVLEAHAEEEEEEVKATLV